MVRRARILKYVLALFILFWITTTQVSVITFIYSHLGPQVDALPQLNSQFVPALIILTMVGTVAVGYKWFGSLQGFLVEVAGWLDEQGDDDGVLVEGRIVEDEFAWRLRYTKDNRITVMHRECPKCGTEVVEKPLPSNVVFGPNTAFNAPEASRSVSEDVWSNVTGKDKADDTGETLALTCPDCNVAEPGEKELLEGKDTAIARFRRHIEEMKSPNPKNDPFKTYYREAQRSGIRDPMPTDIWDAYATTTDSPDVKPVQGQFHIERANQKHSSVGE